MAGVSVFLAMPTHRDIPPQTVRCLLETQAALMRRGIPLGMEMQAGSSLVHHARSKAAVRFLQTDFTRLFWIDSDIVWRVEDFIRLLALSTRMECVCAAYPSKADPPVFMLNAKPGEVIAANEYGCLPIHGAGLGFTVVQRMIIEQLADRAPKCRFPDIEGGPAPHIFRCDDSNGDARGEDMAFFADIRALGYTINLDPTVGLGHIGAKEYRASILDHLKETTNDHAG